MPELPEVETTAVQLRRLLVGASIVQSRFSGKALRHPFPEEALASLQGQTLLAVRRRAKFLVLEFREGWMVVHLGMSGSIRCSDPSIGEKLHDHVWVRFEHSQAGRQLDLVFHDPRRFGSWQWVNTTSDLGWEKAVESLSRAGLGMEPFDPGLRPEQLYEASRHVASPIKQWLLSGRVIVGVGNIYASEALFDAGIHPARKPCSISLERYQRLLESIREILSQAIRSGGSTLRDFQSPDGVAGAYRSSHRVYGRQGEPCPRCKTPIRKIIQQQRSTFYCHVCQR